MKPEESFSDISSSHAHKTVTIESHPHLSITLASIHPCKHADTMKNLFGRSKDLELDHYLIIFLKFMSTIIPTVEYDFTASL